VILINFLYKYPLRFRTLYHRLNTLCGAAQYIQLADNYLDHGVLARLRQICSLPLTILIRLASSGYLFRTALSTGRAVPQ
jgi:hypothetical protein